MCLPAAHGGLKRELGPLEFTKDCELLCSWEPSLGYLQEHLLLIIDPSLWLSLLSLSLVCVYMCVSMWDVCMCTCLCVRNA